MKQSIKFYQQEIILCLKCIKDNLNLPTVLVGLLPNTKKEFKSLKKIYLQK